MNKYEIMFILHPELDEETRNKILKTLTDVLVADGGVVDSTNEWGLRELAYEINHLRRGYYVVLDATVPSANVIEFERVARINANVIRYITIRK